MTAITDQRAAIPGGYGLFLCDAEEDADGLTAAIAGAASQAGIPTTSWSDAPQSGTVLLGQIPMTVRLQRLALRFAVQRVQDADVVITGA